MRKFRIDTKPLSVNRAYRGRRFKSVDYKEYERELLYLLPSQLQIPDGEIFLDLKYGFSNKNSDIDNPCKIFQDILQKRYGFNDNRIYKLNQEKQDVGKGEEFIEFEVSQY